MQQGQGSQTPGLTTFNSNVVPPGAQGQPYRGQQGQDQQSIQQEGDTGRATPPPARSISDMTEEDANAYTQMQKDYKELREKYQKVKKYYFEKESQVHALQNTIAHSRLAASRTSLDDSEYAQRFLRLHGLIQNLSFGIRKDWKTIPILLQPAVNKDATTVGKQEMTCVGRSYIASWLVDELFDKYFHPDLEVGLSTQLKLIQQNIRKFAPPFQSGEEEESLASKIISWRLSTLEGLQESLRSPQAAANRERLVEILIEKLTASLQMHLQVPPPRELDAGVPMIVELAVKLAVNLPLESRDVLIEYFPPGHPILPDVMSIESGVPPLTNPHDDADRASLVSTASDLKESPSEREGGETPVSAGGNVANSKDQDKSRRGMFGNFMGSKKTGPPSTQQKQAAGAGGSQVSLTQGQQPPGSSNGPKEDQQPPRVRMAAGLAIQIRGKSVLVKAPVYSTV
ncbi:hypothetical protein M501DRAFT_924136 [Patellaria atrata CBS 101060]|uniref:Uncharacterized protein n=1 Tax=Patellaria atrata CBS 101060 TaxID=1346257 RepID=A0A9P4SIF2_9PEZI|nr:hypothetical protein M501DRAFT_924136 [Patellaria atrata CBS 101060]